MSKFVMIIFGASGDLTKRKLMPALYSLYKDNRLPEAPNMIITNLLIESCFF